MARAQVDAAVSAIYRAALDPDLWPQALEQVADHAGANGAMIVRNDFDRGGGEILVARLRDDLSQLYLERHYANPLVLAVSRRAPLGRAALGCAYVDGGAIRRTEFHADILAPQSVVDQAFMPHRALSPRGSTGGFALTLNRRQADDGAAIVERLQMLGPHLSRAFDISMEISGQRRESACLDRLVDLMPGAAMLIGCNGRVTHGNAAAEALLASGDGLGASAGTILRDVLVDDDRRLRRAIAAALAFGGGEGDARGEQTLALHRRSGLPAFLAILVPIAAATFAFLDFAERQAALLLRVIDPAQELPGRERLLLKAYGLTAAEARVAVLVARNLSAPAAAAKLGVSVNTVRTHLGRIFDKTGVHSQVALTALLAAIGPA